jgi:hypothetical protein
MYVSKVKTMLACFFFLLDFSGAITEAFSIQIFEHWWQCMCQCWPNHGLRKLIFYDCGVLHDKRSLSKWVLIQRKNIGVGKCYLPNVVPLDILCFWKQEFPSKDFIFNYIHSKMVTAERAHKICRNYSRLGTAKIHTWILKVLCALQRSVTEYGYFTDSVWCSESFICRSSDRCNCVLGPLKFA